MCSGCKGNYTEAETVRPGARNVNQRVAPRISLWQLGSHPWQSSSGDESKLSEAETIQSDALAMRRKASADEGTSMLLNRCMDLATILVAKGKTLARLKRGSAMH